MRVSRRVRKAGDARDGENLLQERGRQDNVAEGVWVCRGWVPARIKGFFEELEAREPMDSKTHMSAKTKLT